SPDLAHEPHTWDDPVLGRALCEVHGELRSAYQQHGVEAHLHAVRQKPRETLRAFISRFTKVRGTIPHISDASIITAFRQGYVMRRCSRNWRRTRWKALPRFSPWLISVPGPLRAA